MAIVDTVVHNTVDFVVAIGVVVAVNMYLKAHRNLNKSLYCRDYPFRSEDTSYLSLLI